MTPVRHRRRPRCRRTRFPATIDSAAGLPNEDEVRRNLAGTVSLAQSTLREQLFGYQALAGLTIGLTESLAIDIALRIGRFSELDDGGSYISLRSHVSNLRVDGSEPVVYRAGARDTGFSALTVGLIHCF